MRHKFSELRDEVLADPVRREHIAEIRRAIADVRKLAALREGRELTQRQVAATLGVSQANVSRIEHEDDLYLSTLRGYVEALGGRLELAAVFEDEVVYLTERPEAMPAEDGEPLEAANG